MLKDIDLIAFQYLTTDPPENWRKQGIFKPIRFDGLSDLPLTGFTDLQKDVIVNKYRKDKALYERMAKYKKQYKQLIEQWRKVFATNKIPVAGKYYDYQYLHDFDE